MYTTICFPVKSRHPKTPKSFYSRYTASYASTFFSIPIRISEKIFSLSSYVNFRKKNSFCLVSFSYQIEGSIFDNLFFFLSSNQDIINQYFNNNKKKYIKCKFFVKLVLLTRRQQRIRDREKKRQRSQSFPD
jgi:hypothetical protein